MFNQVNKYQLYAFKMMMMILAINNGYVIIRYFYANWVVTLFSFVLAVNVGLFDYALTFDSTYKMQDRIATLHKNIHDYIGAMTIDANTKRLLRKDIGGIPAKGIQVGNFYIVQRDSTMEFMDFVSGQLVGLLVTFT